MHAPIQRPPFAKVRHRADNEKLLQEIANFCRRVGMAESTFGRRAVNDGKFVTRLRFGGRVTTHTVERVRAFISRTAGETPRAAELFGGTLAPRTALPQTADSIGRSYTGFPDVVLIFAVQCDDRKPCRSVI